MKLARKVGVTSEIWQIFIRDSSSTTGAGLTGLTNASSSLTAYYHRDTDTTATAISLVTMTVGTFTSSGFKEIDATNMPGWYQFCPPNAALASGAKSCGIHLKGATNMVPLPIEVDLQADVNLTHAAGTAVTLDANNVLNVSAKYWAGSAITASSIPVATAAGASNGLLINGTNTGTPTWTGGLVVASVTGSVGGAVASVTAGVTLAASQSFVNTEQRNLVCVTRVSASGAMTVYTAAGNTNAQRGTALTTALAAASNGDKLILGPCAFDIGASLLDLSLAGTGTVHLIGPGAALCTIYGIGGFDISTGGAIVHPGILNCVCRGFTFDTTAANAKFAAAWGAAAGQSGFANALLEDVVILGDTDGIDVQHTSQVCSGTIRRVQARTKWDCCVLAASFGGKWIIEDCNFYSDGSSAVGSAISSGVAFDLAEEVHIRRSLLDIKSVSGESHGIFALNNGDVYLSDLQIRTSGTGSLNEDITIESGGNARVFVGNAVRYNTAKVTGAVTMLDTANVQTRLPTSLSGGNMKSTVVAGGISSTSFAAGAITSTVAPNLDAAVSTRLAPTTAGRTLNVDTAHKAPATLDGTNDLTGVIPAPVLANAPASASDSITIDNDAIEIINS